ncbi:MAG: T9SS type A sorting domain-containing protein, partial [Bacteroidota bacterium]|nr:T9SS type A sorting domain-containing protein [Bacteroidota bacterium]
LRTTNGGIPVELQSFSAVRDADGSVQLQWVTATESGNFGFEVQRRDAQRWETLGFVAGAGNSTAERQYAWTDTDVPAGTGIAYRLRQVDTDGSVEYSPVVEVAASTAAARMTLDAFPQPMRNGGGMLRVGIGAPGHVRVRIHDMQGRVITTLLDGPAEAGTHVLRWNGSALPAGAYLAVLQSGTERVQQTLLLLK